LLAHNSVVVFSCRVGDPDRQGRVVDAAERLYFVTSPDNARERYLFG
jgi:hypothetical protein